jgi:hypothetical protein
MGKQAVISHEKSMGHIKNTKAKTNSDSLTIPLLVQASVTKRSGKASSGQTESAGSQPKTQSHKSAPPKLEQTSVMPLAVEVPVVHADIRWCLKMVQHHLPMRSADGLASLFADMFGSKV